MDPALHHHPALPTGSHWVARNIQTQRLPEKSPESGRPVRRPGRERRQGLVHIPFNEFGSLTLVVSLFGPLALLVVLAAADPVHLNVGMRDDVYLMARKYRPSAIRGGRSTPTSGPSPWRCSAGHSPRGAPSGRSGSWAGSGTLPMRRTAARRIREGLAG